ncbi:MAG: hypothetical protein AVDCRST_MAG11-2915 [uncultured Gemmatimonadaceae bacterium]|uniref:non-specific serine/threonine protein kinase n=1 Tax=uncultured Gemmatimonadaceae bacterium TaxID=246130 RepID=A0A6J4LRR9_9BACT|nr:MAG: hypothetical protein AVDCRST_MAG11-2915 [uncultured Gemmatimonadaceae bacterium]
MAKAMSTARTTPADGQLTRMGVSLGSPAYMAPEQGAGDPDTDHRADLYALGAMAYELLAGQPPFGDRPAHAQLVAHLSERPVPIADRRADVPEPLARLVMWCLEKDPADRPQQASEVLEALADASSVERLRRTGQHGARPPAGTAAGAAAGPRRRRGAYAAVGALVVAASVGGYWYSTRTTAGTAPGPDASLVAVMPFAVRDASLNVWREGMVDILSRSLDGAGTLRTVPPSTSIAQSPERGDVATATALGRSLGAGLVVFGELSPSGKDSVQLRAALVDVARGAVRQDVNVRGEASRVDALADSLALRMLPSMGSGGANVMASTLSSMGTASLPALKAYLQGQQYYRRGLTDSSRLAYEAAVAADSLFSLGWRGVASIYIRTGRESAPEAHAALGRAIRLRRGGSPRDSMLLRGDSLRLALVRRAPAANDALADVPGVHALLATLRDATGRYPSDAELWLELGDAGYHFGGLAGVADSVVLRDFERAIALDSMVLVPYVHAYGLALRTGRLREASRHARRLARLGPANAAPYYVLQATLLDSAPVVTREARALLDTLPARYVAFALQEVRLAPEATALALAMAAHVSSRLSRDPSAADSGDLGRAVPLARAHRGKVVGGAPPLTFGDRAQLTVAGLLPAERVLVEARALLARQPADLLPAMALFAGARDTISLKALVPAFDRLDAAARAQETTRPAVSGVIARAYLALARADSTAALRGLLALPMSACGGIPCAPLTTSRLLVRAGRDADAARVLDRALPSALAQLSAPLLMQERAAVAERLGDTATARLWYARILAQWGQGDQPTQAALDAARSGAARVR